ncbi:uncharacterized protein MYCFIDRAFT_177601 [Pseudocercospora fijiensis CIRAD86]|uniref:Uncharacterized protein n=1 Tax=Pseudocercospora fijiensis (strain CIRAD86) TaxID=383855 RepID=M2YSH7_PSEFD|nr:uncharacterized protein MYCFIDRAFT_177601 [Pseudocercospora fijiensis CIRAD86]EME80670.1 hypothetical protein MYCFIDRAFT_177601 [Pseudocercospora fijiensis CIRAD86]
MYSAHRLASHWISGARVAWLPGASKFLALVIRIRLNLYQHPVDLPPTSLPQPLPKDSSDDILTVTRPREYTRKHQNPIELSTRLYLPVASINVVNMPAAGRGDPLTKTTNYNWTDDEYSTLHIIQVEHAYLEGPDITRLWHQRFPQHMSQGREYNATKLKETWQFRHYKGKSAKWKTIARPNRRPEGEDQTQHTAQEQAHFQTLRQELQTAANACTPPITLQAPTAPVDSGIMCGCNACQRKVQGRDTAAAQSDAVKDKKGKGKARGISAKASSVNGVSKKTDKESARNKRPVKKSSALGDKQPRSRREMKRPIYADPRSESDENDAEMEEEEMEEGSDPDAMDLDDDNLIDEPTQPTSRPQDAVPGLGMPAASMRNGAMSKKLSTIALSESKPATHMNTGPSRYNGQDRATSNQFNLGNASSRPGAHTMLSIRTSQVNAAAPENARSQSDRSSSGGKTATKPSGASHPHGKKVDEPAVDLANVERAEGSLRMVHYKNLFVADDKLRLQDGFTLVKQDTPLYRHGGQVMMIAPSLQKPGPFMVCDTNKCTGCKRKAEKNLESPTEGLPFVHLRQCLRDEHSGRLLFQPEDICENLPASSDQPLDLANVVIVCPGLGAKVYRVVVCDVNGCTYCSQREARGLPRGLSDITFNQTPSLYGKRKVAEHDYELNRIACWKSRRCTSGHEWQTSIRIGSYGQENWEDLPTTSGASD